jgi:hypothetical protein
VADREAQVARLEQLRRHVLDMGVWRKLCPHADRLEAVSGILSKRSGGADADKEDCVGTAQELNSCGECLRRDSGGGVNDRLRSRLCDLRKDPQRVISGLDVPEVLLAAGSRQLLDQRQLEVMKALEAELLGAANHGRGGGAGTGGDLAHGLMDHHFRLIQEQAGNARIARLEGRHRRQDGGRNAAFGEVTLIRGVRFHTVAEGKKVSYRCQHRETRVHRIVTSGPPLAHTSQRPLAHGCRV